MPRVLPFLPYFHITRCYCLLFVDGSNISTDNWGAPVAPRPRSSACQSDPNETLTRGRLLIAMSAFIRYLGVQIPQDFRVSIKKTFKDAATHEPVTRAEIEEIPGGGGGGPIIICDCVVFCFLRYGVIFCYCTIIE
jgi:hypothetical protein